MASVTEYKKVKSMVSTSEGLLTAIAIVPLAMQLVLSGAMDLIWGMFNML